MKKIDFEGIPFVWGGIDPVSGLDCFTLAQHFRAKAKLPLLPSYYHRTAKDIKEGQLKKDYILACFMCDPSAYPIPEPRGLGDIVLQDTKTGWAIGTYWDGEVLMFGRDRRSHWHRLDQLGDRKYWKIV